MSSTHNRVFIRNLPYEITEKELLDEFKQFGEIFDPVLIKDRGIAFLSFQDENSYQKCLNMNNNLKIQGRQIGICVALPSQSEENNNNNYSSDYIDSRNDFDDYDTIFVGNIVNNVEDYQVREAFMKYQPYEVKMCDGEDHKIQYALIRILKPELIEKAIREMNGYNLNGSKISVSIAEYSLY